MFFQSLGRAVRRAWLPLLLLWVFLVVAGRLLAPSWGDVAQDREFEFLPADSPSRRAEEVFARAFPEDGSGSNIVLVLHRADNDKARHQKDLKFIEDMLEPGLRGIAEAEGGLAFETQATEEPLFSGEGEPARQQKPRSIIARVQTPNAPGIGALLVSPDGQAMLVVVELTTDFLSKRNWPTITKVEGLVHNLREQGKVPEGLEIALTGSAVVGRDHSHAELQSVRATGFLTVLLVVVLLVLIYRAPLLALIPLATVYLAVQLSTSVLSLLAESGHVTLFQGLQIYITILAYGAGVDYCLFLTARYKEELDHGAGPADAVARALGAAGGAVAASAATVMCGIAMMLFAQFGKFREAGFAIPLSLLLVLAATLTFSPALLRLAGRWAFWPQRAGAGPRDGREPPAKSAAAVPWWRQLFQAGELERIWDWTGHLLLRKAGTVWLATVAVMLPFAVVAGFLSDRVSYDVIGNLPSDASSAAGSRLLQEHFPAGVLGPATVLLVDPHVDFRSPQGRELVKRVTDRLHEQEAQLGLNDVRSLTAPLGLTKAAQNPSLGYDVPEEVRKEAADRAAVEHYVTDLGGRDRIGTRFELVLSQSPFARDSLNDLDRIEQAIRAELPETARQDSQLYVTGTTASVRDLSRVMQADRGRIELLVLASVFVILVVLLRGLVVPIYLLLSVLFSYYTTLGVAFAVFWALDPHGFAGVDWKVAIFLFTILIAVGEDYNIFLMTRVREEQQRHGPLLGITEALDRTGPIISSCGIIMAGTFGSLLAGSLNEMKQLGFALAFGILLDTFVVRPILVPAFLVLLERMRLDPSTGEGNRPWSPTSAA